MFKKVMLDERLSRSTVNQVYRYLFDFGQGAHCVFWVDERPYIEMDCPSDINLLKERFPKMIAPEVDGSAHDFSW